MGITFGKLCRFTTAVGFACAFFEIQALAQTAYYTYEAKNGTISITGYIGLSGHVTIPSVINGLAVTGIGDNAFCCNGTLIEVTIPDSVISIGVHAFYSNPSLTKVTIPNSVTSIGDSAFSQCRSLTSVAIGTSLTSIAQSTFTDCTSLTSVTIPAR